MIDMMRVLSFTALHAGARGLQYLADLGAERRQGRTPPGGSWERRIGSAGIKVAGRR